MSDPAPGVRTTFSSAGSGDPAVSFGDLIELPWLGDLHLQPASERLMTVTMKGGRAGFRPAEDHEQAAQWVGFASRATSARHPVRAVIVSDECQVEDVLYGRPVQDGARALPPGGRLMLAPLRPAQLDEIDMDAFKRAPVGPAAQWPVPDMGFDHGGLIDFDQVFNIKLAEQDVTALVAGRIGIPDERQILLRRWSAYAVRRGPLVAQTAAVQARQLLTGEAASDTTQPVPPALFGLLGLLWAAEGQVEDRISQAAERVRLVDARDRAAERMVAAEQLRTDLLKATKAIATAADAAAAELHALNPTT